MLKFVTVVLGFALLAEAVIVVPLVKLEEIKSKATELQNLKTKYKDLIKSQQDKVDSLFQYNSKTYRGQFLVSSAGEEFRIVFATGSFHNIYSRGLVAAELFSFDLKQAALLLGDNDSKYYDGEITYVPLTSDKYWQFEMGASMNGMNMGEKCEAIIDTGNTLIVVPDSHYNSVMNVIGATFNNNYNTYTVDCSTIATLPALHLSIGQGTFTITPNEYVLQSEGICSTVFESIGTHVWILGDVFIEKYYAVFDLASKRVGFALAK